MAAITLFTSSCSATNVEAEDAPVTTQAEPSPITERVEGYDELDAWSTGRLIDLDWLQESFGVAVYDIPQEFFDMGYIGVAELEQYCIVAFSVEGTDPASANVSVVIFSRYNQSYTQAYANVPLDQVRLVIDGERDFCAGTAWKDSGSRVWTS